MPKQIQKIINRHKFVIISIIGGFILASVICTVSYSLTQKAMNSLTSEVFRFHVIANSDSKADQALKLKVRDAILARFSEKLTTSGSKSETMNFFKSNLTEVIKTAEDTLEKNGCMLPVTASVTKSHFPIRHYSDITLPAGTYDCLRIEIGSAKGHNWWCVMYPPLCYVNTTYKESEQQRFKNTLTPSSYSLILADNPDAPPKVKLKLKVVELWQELK